MAAPERIWAWTDPEYDVKMWNEHGDARYTPKNAVTEYVRADLSGWQPIETAPKDRETLMRGFLAAILDEDGDPEAIEWLGAPGYPGTRLNLNSNNYTSFQATHWCPLPEPPEKSP